MLDLLPLCSAVTSADFQSIGMVAELMQSLKRVVIVESRSGGHGLKSLVGKPETPGPLAMSRLSSVFFTMISVTRWNWNLSGLLLVDNCVEVMVDEVDGFGVCCCRG